MTATEQIKGAVLTALENAGLTAQAAWPAPPAGKLTGPETVVGTRELCVMPHGMTDYLGERYDALHDTTVEVYGRRMQVRLSLDVYAPGSGGGAACEAAAEQVTEVLLSALPAGLKLGTIRWEETVWNKTYGAFLRRGCAEAADDDTVVEDFILKGEVRE